jgi:hypothetical protein
LIRNVKIKVTHVLQTGLRFGHLKQRFSFDARDSNISINGKTSKTGIGQASTYLSIKSLLPVLFHQSSDSKGGVRAFTNRGDNPIAAKSIKAVVSDDNAVGIIEGGSKSSTDNIAQHVEENNIVFIEGI